MDIGTGDGRYLLERARKEARTRFIGIEPNHSGLSEASRKGSKLENLQFVLGSLDELPGCFSGAAASVSVLFPWGSLLRAVAAPESEALVKLRSLLAPGGSIEVVTAIDPKTDATELRSVVLDGFSLERTAEGWRQCGFEVALSALADDHSYQTTWWRRIRQRDSRTAYVLTARPGELPTVSPGPVVR